MSVSCMSRLYNDPSLKNSEYEVNGKCDECFNGISRCSLVTYSGQSSVNEVAGLNLQVRSNKFCLDRNLTPSTLVIKILIKYPWRYLCNTTATRGRYEISGYKRNRIGIDLLTWLGMTSK